MIDNRIKHVIIDDRNKLDAIRGSKYYQSDTSNIYNDVISFLKVDKTVLFSGTACQVAGLLSVVPDKLKAKLLTVDVLCHGVSSKKLLIPLFRAKKNDLRRK